MSDATLARIAKLVSEVETVFAGQPSGAVHAALVNITADFIVHHEMVGDAEATHRVRRSLIAEHFEMVEKLVDAYERKRNE